MIQSGMKKRVTTEERFLASDIRKKQKQTHMNVEPEVSENGATLVIDKVEIR